MCNPVMNLLGPLCFRLVVVVMLIDECQSYSKTLLQASMLGQPRLPSVCFIEPLSCIASTTLRATRISVTFPTFWLHCLIKSLHILVRCR